MDAHLKDHKKNLLRDNDLAADWFESCRVGVSETCGYI